MRIGLIVSSKITEAYHSSVSKISQNIINYSIKSENEIFIISDSIFVLNQIKSVGLSGGLLGLNKDLASLSSLKLDIIHCLSEGYIPMAFWFSRSKKILTLHGAEFFSRPELRARARYRLPEILGRLTIRLFKRRVDKFLTVSSYAIEPWSKGFKIPLSKFDFIYNGLESPSYEGGAGVLDKYGINEPFILHVGNFKPQKNTLRILEAYLELVRDRKIEGVSLVFVGILANDYERLKEHLSRYDYGSVIFTGSVSEKELNEFYQNALCLAFPSLVESFGMPIVESMANKTPVLTSQLSCIPEVCGGSALLINPYNTEDVKAGLLKLIAEPLFREELVSLGLERVKRFTWDKIVAEYLAYYKKLIDSSL